MLRRHVNGIVACLVTCMTLACGEDPLADDSSGSTQSQVRFALGNADTPLDVCLEADLITLDISPEGVIAGGPSQNVFPAPCEATFTVTVKKNREVTFTGEVLGGETAGQERQLLVGQAILPASEAKDGFDVRIQLSDIDALRVSTETIGPGPANDYTFTVNGHPERPIGIGHNDEVVVPAVAAGSRMVELDPAPCGIADQMPNPRPVGVPVPSSDIGGVGFTVTCLSGVNVIWTPGGSCPGVLDLVVDDAPPIPIRAGEVITIPSLPAGIHTFELQNLPANATVATILGPNIQGDNPATVDLPVATSLDLTFLVTCGGARVDDLTVHVVNLTTRTASATLELDGGAQSRSITIGSTAAVSEVFKNLSAGNHVVELIAAPGCHVVSPNPRTVFVPGSTTFQMEC